MSDIGAIESTEDEVIADFPADETPDYEAPEALTSLDPLYCSECDRTFKNSHGKAIHDSRMHGITAEKDGSPSKPRKSRSTRNLEQELTGMFVTMGMAVSFYNPNDGNVVMMHSAGMAKAWAELAATNETVAKVLDGMVTGSAIGGVLMATLPVVIGIMGNHEMINPEIAQMVSGVAMSG